MSLPLGRARAERNRVWEYFAVLDLHAGDITAVPNCQSNLDFHETLLGFKELKSSPSNMFGTKPYGAVAVTHVRGTPFLVPCEART
jgi:hypothetical protein